MSVNSGVSTDGTASYAALDTSNFGAGLGWSTSSTRHRSFFQAPGTIRDFHMRVSVAPGVGKSWTFTLVKNGVDTAVVATISDTAQTGSDLTNSFTVAEGDYVQIKAVGSGTPAAPLLQFSAAFEGTNAKESNLQGGVLWPAVDAARYSTLTSMFQAVNAFTTETDAREVIPTSGTIKRLSMELETAPGSGKSRTYTLYKNGVATALTFTISGTATTGSDLSNTVSVSPGDEISLECTGSSTPAASNGAWCAVFVADVDGESLILGGGNATPSNTATRFQSPNFGLNLAWGASESDRYVLTQECTLRKFHVATDGAPGAGTDFTFDLRRNTASPAGTPTVTIADANTTGSDTSNEVTYADGDLVSVRCVPTGTPTADNYRWGIVQFINPASFISEITYI